MGKIRKQLETLMTIIQTYNPYSRTPWEVLRVGTSFEDPFGMVTVTSTIDDSAAIQGNVYTFHTAILRSNLKGGVKQVGSIGYPNRVLHYVDLSSLGDNKNFKAETPMNGYFHAYTRTFFYNPITLILSENLSMPDQYLVEYRLACTIRGIVLPKKNALKSAWVGGAYINTLLNVSGNGTTAANIYLQRFHMTDDVVKRFVETLGDRSTYSSPGKITIGSTNIANLTDETITLAEQKGWYFA